MKARSWALVALPLALIALRSQAQSPAEEQPAPEPIEQSAPPPAASAPVVLGGMQCSPTPREVETRRPIPIACTTDQPATSVEVKFREFGSTSWSTLPMGSVGGKWLGTIPCSATELQGRLSWYVNARDAQGEVLDHFGALRQPLEVQLVETSTEPPPAHPDQPAPERCGSAGECPEEMLGTPACPGTVKPDPTRGKKAAGAPCAQSSECSPGLDCTLGRCEAPRSCERDADCPQGLCTDGLCAAESARPSEPLLNWLGLHFAIDLASVSGSSVCEDEDFACFYKDGRPVGSRGETFSGPLTSSGEVTSGFALGTLRLLASYERLLGAQLGVEGRVGLALNGAPTGDGVSFLPLHLEARAKYWPLGAPGSTTVAPYLLAGAGLAQVDAMVSTVIAQNCGTLPNSQCADNPEVDVYRQMGVGFVTVGGGAAIAVAPNLALNLNLNGLYLFPKSGLVLQPTLGAVYGL